MDETGERLSREPWVVKYADSESVAQNNCNADKIFDLQESTYWKTEQGVEFPHSIVIDLGAEHTISAIQYFPRMEEGAPGSIKEFKLYIKGEEFKIKK